MVAQVLNNHALVSLSVNKEGNVDYEPVYQNPVDSLQTAKGRGTTYKKLLCMAFDLSLLIYYSSESFFKFVYHDGALEGLDRRKRIKWIQDVKSICNKYGLQYIMTTIDSDIPRNDTGEIHMFNESEICLKLHDDGDDGTLFKMNF